MYVFKPVDNFPVYFLGTTVLRLPGGSSHNRQRTDQCLRDPGFFQQHVVQVVDHTPDHGQPQNPVPRPGTGIVVSESAMQTVLDAQSRVIAAYTRRIIAQTRELFSKGSELSVKWIGIPRGIGIIDKWFVRTVTGRISAGKHRGMTGQSRRRRGVDLCVNRFLMAGETL